MPDMIRDGTGSAFLQKVDANNRAHIQAVNVPVNQNATKNGDSYNINTGVITLTDAVQTPILYLKNNGDKDLHITAIDVGIGPSTGGSGGIPVVTIIRDPTAGTIVSNAIDVDINSNRNFGSSKTLVVDAFKGATGNTMTDGTDHILIFQATNSRSLTPIDEVLDKGSSLGIKITPQTSNTSMDVYGALICHLDDPANED